MSGNEKVVREKSGENPIKIKTKEIKRSAAKKLL